MADPQESCLDLVSVQQQLSLSTMDGAIYKLDSGERGLAMKFAGEIALGVVASFVLLLLGSLILGVFMLHDVPIPFAAVLAFWPLIALGVGAFVGRTAEPDRARSAAALSLVPLVVFLLIRLNFGQAWSFRTITVVGTLLCVALCVASASVTSTRRAKVKQRKA